MIAVGKEIEELVACYLKRRGLELIATNYNCNFGEIDLIMQDQKELVFIEVRYRNDAAYGDGVDSVDTRKRHKIKKTAAHYLLQQDLYDKVNCRFDVVAVSGKNKKQVTWIKDAFWEKW